MRILFISQEFGVGSPWGAGGVGVYTELIAETLADRGHEVHVLVCTPEPVALDEQRGAVVVHHRPTLRLRGARLILESGTLRRVDAAASAFHHTLRLGLDFDVIEVPEWLGEGFLLTLARLAPVVVHLHTPSALLDRHNGMPSTSDARRADWIERTAARRADALTSPSRLLRENLLADGWLGPGHEVTVIAPPVAATSSAGIRDVTRTLPSVLAVGRIEARKSPDVLCAAVNEVAIRVPGCTATYIGRPSGDLGGQTAAAWIAAHPPDVCRFAGEVGRTDLLSEYEKARVVVVASSFESFSLATVEAMAAGRPVVVTSEVGAAELLACGGGTVVPAGDVAALSAAIQPFLEDAQHAARVGEIGRSIATARCAPDAVAQRREDVYLAAARRWRSRRTSRLVGRFASFASSRPRPT